VGVKRELLVVLDDARVDEALALLQQGVRDGLASLHIVVTARPASDHWTWTAGEAHVRARHRLTEALGRLDELGFCATGQVGDANPIDAMSDALRERGANAVVIASARRVGVYRRRMAMAIAEQFGVERRDVTLAAT
jgi:hypothetical protein